MKSAFILANAAAPSTTTSIGPGAAAPAAPAGQTTETIQQPGAPAGEPQQSQQVPFFQNPLLLMILVFGVMIFFTFRSQKKQQKKRAQMLDAIIKGDRVMLNSGMFGKIVEVRDKSYVVEIGDRVNVEVVKNGVAEKVMSEAPAETK